MSEMEKRSKIVSNNNADNIVSSIKIIGYFILFIIILIGTYLFSLKNESKYIIPFTLTLYFFCLINVYYLVHILFIPILNSEQNNSNDDSDNLQKRKNVKLKIVFSDMFTLLLAWMFWMVYGLIFEDISSIYGKVWIYIQTFLLWILVFLSYIKRILDNRIFVWNIIIFFFILVLFFPSKDCISTKLSDIVLMTKVIFFIILYIINDYKLQIPDEVINMINDNIKKKIKLSDNNPILRNSRNGIESRSNSKFDIESQVTGGNESKTNIREMCLRMRFVGLLRAYWVLSCSKYLVVFCLLQILPIIMHSYINCAKNSNAFEQEKYRLTQALRGKSKKRSTAESSNNNNNNNNTGKSKDEIEDVYDEELGMNLINMSFNLEDNEDGEDEDNNNSEDEKTESNKKKRKKKKENPEKPKKKASSKSSKISSKTKKDSKSSNCNLTDKDISLFLKQYGEGIVNNNNNNK